MCHLYGGGNDAERQQRQKRVPYGAHGRTVIPVDAGSGTLKDAVNEALARVRFCSFFFWRNRIVNPNHDACTCWVLPLAHIRCPTIVREFHRMIGAPKQKNKFSNRKVVYPDEVIACVGRWFECNRYVC